MLAYTRAAYGYFGSVHLTGATTMVREFLCGVLSAAERAADFSRYAGLPRRYLDDVDLTPADFDCQLAPLDAPQTQATLTHSL